MSLIQKLLGNAVEIDHSSLENLMKPFLIPHESIVVGYSLMRDKIIFTTERLMLIDVQGITGSKVSYTSIPYSSIKYYSMETAGSFDLDAEIILFIQAMPSPLKLTFKKGTDLTKIYTQLSQYILRDN